jgi:hypothetical protein
MDLTINVTSYQVGEKKSGWYFLYWPHLTPWENLTFSTIILILLPQLARYESSWAHEIRGNMM